MASVALRSFASRRAAAAAVSSSSSTRLMSSSSKDGGETSHASVSYDKMATDARYASTTDMPTDRLLSKENVTEEFSIRGQFREGRAAYLDMSATTPLDPRVFDAMAPYMIGSFGNPHSRTHSYGWEAEKVVETARAQVAGLIGASPKEVVFTSGATESNNMSIKGVARFYGKSKKNKKHVITTQTEHKCVLDSCRSLEQEGFDVTYLPVQRATGRVDLEQLKAHLEGFPSFPFCHQLSLCVLGLQPAVLCLLLRLFSSLESISPVRVLGQLKGQESGSHVVN